MRNPHRLKDMLLEVVVQFLARSALDQDARPVAVDAVLPDLAWLVDEWLGEDIVVGAGELVNTERASPLI